MHHMINRHMIKLYSYPNDKSPSVGDTDVYLVSKGEVQSSELVSAVFLLPPPTLPLLLQILHRTKKSSIPQETQADRLLDLGKVGEGPAFAQEAVEAEPIGEPR